MTLAPELAGAGALIDVLLARGVVVSSRPHRRDRRAGERRVRRGRTRRHPPLQRDAAAAPSRPGHRRRGARARRRLRLDHPRRHPSRSRDRAHRLEGGARAHVLVSDAIAAAPRSDGPSTLGELDLQVHEGAVRGPDGVLAGSVADDDRGCPQPARSSARRSRTRSERRRSRRPGCSATRSSAASTSGYRPTSSC